MIETCSHTVGIGLCANCFPVAYAKLKVELKKANAEQTALRKAIIAAMHALRTYQAENVCSCPDRIESVAKGLSLALEGK